MDRADIIAAIQQTAGANSGEPLGSHISQQHPFIFTSTEATIVGALVGGLLALVGSAVTQRWQRADRRTEIRRNAYAALIIELDYLERFWEAPETVPVPDDEMLRDTTGVAVGRIQQTYAAVRLVGSEKARSRAKAALDAAWDLSNLFHTPHTTKGFLGKFAPTLDAFTAAARAFVAQAESEVAP